MSRTNFLTILILSLLVFVRSQGACKDANCLACPYHVGRCEICNTGYFILGFACVTACPANSSPTNSRCTCNQGYADYGFTCILIADCPWQGGRDTNGFCNSQSVPQLIFGGAGTAVCPPFSSVGIGASTVCMCNYPLYANPYTASCVSACPTGMQPDINYNCVCPSGQLDYWGVCVTPASCTGQQLQYGNRCLCFKNANIYYEYDMQTNSCVTFGGSPPQFNGAYWSFFVSAPSGGHCNFLDSGSSCISAYPGYYLLAGQSSGFQCSAGCYSCTDGSTCTVCNNGYYLSGGTCTSNSCAQSSSSTTCLSCVSPKILQNGACITCSTSIYNGTCVTSCPPGTYGGVLAGNSQALCLPCITGCQFCTSAGCIVCNSGYTMASNGTCSLCPLNCIACSTTGMCLTCNGTYYLSHNGSCVSLPPNCFTGTSSGECVTCVNGTQWNNGSCVTTCSNGTYFNNNMCNSCSTGCASCTTGTACTLCNTGFTLNSTTNNCSSTPTNSTNSTNTTVSTAEAAPAANSDRPKIIAALVLAVIALVAMALLVVGVTTAIKTMRADIRKGSTGNKYNTLDGTSHPTSPSHDTESNAIRIKV